jgi:hypothetical protein
LVDLKKKLKALRRHPLTQIQLLDPNVIYPVKASWVWPMSAGLLLLEWFFFYYLVPYSTIPSKSVFWLAFVGWASPPVIAEWVYRNAPTKRAIDKYSNLFIGIGLSGLVLAVAARRVEVLLPVAYALMAGAMAGGLVSGNMTLLWRHFKGPGPTRT